MEYFDIFMLLIISLCILITLKYPIVINKFLFKLIAKNRINFVLKDIENNCNLYKNIDHQLLNKVNNNLCDSILFAHQINVTNQQQKIYLTHHELNAHMFINGTTGSGKTVAFMNFVENACCNNLPLIYIDGKGSFDLIDKINYFTNKYQRTFRVFSLKPELLPNPARYDFLGNGTFTEQKNRIMQLFINADSAGSAYYQDKLERFINAVLRTASLHHIVLDLFIFVQLVQNINYLIELAQLKKDNLLIEYFITIKQLKKDSPHERILDMLDVFINSSYGQYFKIINQETQENNFFNHIINIREAILNKEIILFLLDNASYPIDTNKIAKMIISDINSVFANFGVQNPKIIHKTFCIFDEFASYATDLLSNTISIHRSNGMHAIIGTQSITTVAKAGIHAGRIAEEILSCCNTFLVLATTNDKDALRLANIFGTKQYNNISFSHGIQQNGKEHHSILSKKIDDFIIKPQAIKNIPINSGIGYLYRKSINQAPIKVLIVNQLEPE